MITIGDLFRRNALHNPHGIAVIYGDERVTHAEMLTRVETASRRLAAMKLHHQDRFAILSKNALEYLELYGAAECTGFVAVVLARARAQRVRAQVVSGWARC